MMTVGESIRTHRKQMGLTQGRLAKKVGTAQVTVSHWERELCDPSLISLICLADIFHITLDELVGRDTYIKRERKDNKRI